MALFEPHRTRESEEILGSDAATRALSVTRRRERFRRRRLREHRLGLRLHLRADAAPRPRRGDPADGHQAGRSRARSRRRHRHQRLAVSARLLGHRHRPVEPDAREGARARRAQGRPQRPAARRWTRPNLKFADDTFDIVYAPYVISVVPDPVAVDARDASASAVRAAASSSSTTSAARTASGAWLERLISPFTVHIGFKSDLDLPAFLAQADLKPVSIEKVNVPRIWSLVTCIKD